MTGLRVAAAVEALSITVLLANLATVHWEQITSVAGPLHGMAYVTVIALAFTQSSPDVRWRAFLPGVGGVLALRRLRAPSTRKS
ncbi:DUF3817 domain-containing protein [Saccharothrix hoggarensis]|uniref:DUF3817 domain-containing protein n=1 Tax=Saccharothrix hoggarensis TaxID=913853 RepID=A0ABW3R4A6_9PSEU